MAQQHSSLTPQQDLVASAARLGISEMRHQVELLRLQSRTTGDQFAVIALDCTQTRERPLDGVLEQINRLDALVRHGWAHETVVGWLRSNQLGVLLPNASPMDAWEFAEEVRSHCGADAQTVSVYTGYATRLPVASTGEVKIPSVDELFLQPVPAWKRMLDLGLSVPGLVVAFPFLLLAALLIKTTSRGPIFFRQQRVGQGGKHFTIYKLRTMRPDADDIKCELRSQNEVDGLGFKIEDDPRVTWIGRFFRRTSLDELPQLWNVIRGDMSMVGPRPLPCSDWHPTDLWMNERHDVKPGLTCTWQIKGRPIRSNVSFEEWMLMDIEYIESCNLLTDLRLIAQTIPAVLSQRGAS